MKNDMSPKVCCANCGKETTVKKCIEKDDLAYCSIKCRDKMK